MNELTIGSGDEASFSIGTLMGNVEWGPFTGDFQGKMKKEILETDASRRRSPLRKLFSPLSVYFER